MCKSKCIGEGLPEAIRGNNGPAHLSQTVQAWANAKIIRRDFLWLGSPARNAYIERFNGICRVAVFDAHQFRSWGKAQAISDAWLEIYN